MECRCYREIYCRQFRKNVFVDTKCYAIRCNHNPRQKQSGERTQALWGDKINNIRRKTSYIYMFNYESTKRKHGINETSNNNKENVNTLVP